VTVSNDWNVTTVEYASAEGAPLQADLFLPDTAGPHPALIAVSGGGWMRGHRSMLAGWSEFLASRGYAILAIDYRQSADGPSYPENLRDVRAAWSYLRDHSQTYGIAKDRVGLLGASSGAHLAALAALAMPKLPIRSLVLVYGIYDVAAHWEFERNRAGDGSVPLVERMLGSDPNANPQLFHNASPLSLVTPANVSTLRALVLWGTDDDVVSPRQSESFANALAANGATIDPVPVQGAGHFWFSRESPTDSGSSSSAVAGRLVSFLESNLKFGKH
jgi:acetyl esterase/lipase